MLLYLRALFLEKRSAQAMKVSHVGTLPLTAEQFGGGPGSV